MGYVCERTKAEQRELGRGAYLKRSYTKVLGLTLAEGLVYSIVRSFSEKYRDGFTGAQSYISEVIGVTARSVASALSSLVSRGLITKKYITVNNQPHPAYFSDGSLEAELVAQYLDKIEAESIGAESKAPPEGARGSDKALEKCADDNGCAAENSKEQSCADLHGNAVGSGGEKTDTPTHGFAIGDGETGYISHLRHQPSDKPARQVKYFSRGKGDEVGDAMLRALERTYRD